MPQPLTDDELRAAISAAEEAALGDLNGTLSTDRADAIDRYLGKPYGDEIKGRSQVVSRDVSDVVEGVLANVLKPFVGGERVVEFQAHGPEDEQQALQETDYVNFVCMERNNGFMVLASAIKDALLLRTGYVKCSWTTRSDVILERYQGLNDEELAILAQDHCVQIAEHSEYPDPYYVAPPAPPPDPMNPQAMMAPPPPPPMVHDVVVRRTKPTEFVEICPTPPDEILISERARTPSLQQCDFVQHRTRVMLSELRQMGYQVPDDINDDDSGETLEAYARQRWSTTGDLTSDPTQDQARRLVLFKENYLRIDMDGDGIAELRKVCCVGNTILANEETDLIPLVCFAAVLMPHQHVGLSIYDFVQDLAQVKTQLLRQFIDNKYLAINGRTAVDTSRVNLDDMLVSRPGGIVRVNGDPTTAMFPMAVPDTGVTALQGLEYLDTIRESRSGYTRNTAGLENDALTNTTASGMAMQMSQSQLRLEMIARTIAETGVRDLFRLVHALTLKHSTRAEKIKLRNKWVAVNPREWVSRTDLQISVGLGNAVPGLQTQSLMLLAQAQEKAFALGLCNPEKVYNLLAKMTTAAGFRNEEEFFSPPQKDPETGEFQTPPPPKPPQVMVAEINAQADQAKFQAQTQVDMQKFGAEQQAKQGELAMQAQVKEREQQATLQVQAANDQRQAQLDAMEHQRELQRMAMEDQFKRDQMEREFAFKQWEAQQKYAFEAQREGARLEHERDTQRTVARASGVDVDGEDKIASALKPLLEHMQAMMASMAAPKQIVRDQAGRVVGVQTVNPTVQ